VTVLAVLAVPASADSEGNSLTGSWDSQFTVGNLTRLLLVTFQQDGTTSSTPSETVVSTARGVWKKVGPRTFVEKNLSYIFGPDGKVAVISEVTKVIELSEDGQSYAAEGSAVLRFPNGNPAPGGGMFSETATRITID
jgi:hypothetical protein